MIRYAYIYNNLKSIVLASSYDVAVSQLDQRGSRKVCREPRRALDIVRVGLIPARLREFSHQPSNCHINLMALFLYFDFSPLNLINEVVSN